MEQQNSDKIALKKENQLLSEALESALLAAPHVAAEEIIFNLPMTSVGNSID
jgi:hypothetical protein